MKRFLLTLLLSLMPSLALGQGSLQVFAVQSPTGNAIAGATVALCSGLPTQATPCGTTSLQQTYTSITEGAECTLNPTTLGPLYGTGCTNPGLTDGQGMAHIYAAPSNSIYYYQAYGSTIPITNIQPIYFQGTGFPINPQTGDTVCFNCYGDNAWDAVNYARPYIGIYALNQANTPFVSVAGTLYELGNPSVTEYSATGVYPTATLGYGVTFSSSTSGSSSTVIGLSFGQNGSTSLIGMQAFYRWSYRASMGNTASVRYWMGLCTFHSPGTGNNGLACNGSAAYATDSPNKSTEAFLYDPTINSHWQAVVDTAGGSQTTVDTGVVEDTNIHLWEMTTNSTGTAICFWIDNVQVTNPCISTNLPPPANDYDSWGSLFFTGDNKGTATAVSETFYSMQMSLKQ
jgi:hypothetical protein